MSDKRTRLDNVRAEGNDGHGIEVTGGVTVTNSIARNNKGSGFRAVGPMASPPPVPPQPAAAPAPVTPVAPVVPLEKEPEAPKSDKGPWHNGFMGKVVVGLTIALIVAIAGYFVKHYSS